MNTFIFSQKALKAFLKLTPRVQRRIETKLMILKNHHHIYSILKPVHQLKRVTHRLRIGGMRLLLKEQESDHLKRKTFLIVRLGDRRNIYR